MDYKVNNKTHVSSRKLTITIDHFSLQQTVYHQEDKIHAFVPEKCPNDLRLKLRSGNICSITNFEVKAHKKEYKYRCVVNDYNITFSADTKVKDQDEKGSPIPMEAFDFYDHNELLGMAKFNFYLARREEIKICYFYCFLPQ